MFQPQKPFLAHVINLNYTFLSDLVGPTGDMLDGGALLNRIQWPGEYPKTKK